MTWAGAQLRAQNTSGRPCALAGTHPVFVPLHVDPPGTTAASGVLGPGDTLVQGYRRPRPNPTSCPPGPSSSQTAQISVQVEGRTYMITLPVQTIRVIIGCLQYAALPPRIERNLPPSSTNTP